NVLLKVILVAEASPSALRAADRASRFLFRIRKGVRRVGHDLDIVHRPPWRGELTSSIRHPPFSLMRSNRIRRGGWELCSVVCAAARPSERDTSVIFRLLISQLLPSTKTSQSIVPASRSGVFFRSVSISPCKRRL